MGLVMVYTCGVLIVIVSFRICRVLQAYHREIYFCGRKLFLKHLALPVVLARRQCVGPITRLQLFSQSAYWLTTLVFNVARSKGLPDAASRAASLALLHVIMLVGMGRMSLFADLLCLPLRSYWKIYRSVGWMTVVQSTIHLSIRVYLQGGGLADPTLRYGLVVYLGMLFLAMSPWDMLSGAMWEWMAQLRFPITIVVVVLLWLHVPKKSACAWCYNPACLLVMSILVALGTTIYVGRLVLRNVGRRRAITEIYMDRGGSSDIVRARLRIPRRWNVRPGQYVYLTTLETSHSSALQAHPFVVAWWQEAGERSGSEGSDDAAFDGLGVRDLCADGHHITAMNAPEINHGHGGNGDTFTIWLLIKPRAGWTGEIVHQLDSTKLSAVIDGPYGGHDGLTCYGHVVLFATDLGIAAQLPFLKALLDRSAAGELPTRRILLIWEVNNGDDLQPIMGWLKELMVNDRLRYRTGMLNISLYVRNRSGASIRWSSRITTHFGSINIKRELDEEWKNRRTTVLITASVAQPVMDRLRHELCAYVDRRVDFWPLDFQP